MLVIGLTGGVGTGKSTVAKLLEEKGAAVLSADTLAHALLRRGGDVWQRARAAFGDGVLDAAGNIDRAALAEIVFSDERRRKELEAIVHPPVLDALRGRAEEARRQAGSALVLEIPLLFEAGAESLADLNVVVIAPEAAQKQRLKEKYGWTDAMIDRRIAAQWALETKAALADVVIDNGKSMQHTIEQVNDLWHKHIKR